MRLPEFTAEASLGKIGESYAVRSKALAEIGSVQPQGLYIAPEGDIVFCSNEGGVSICYTVGWAFHRQI